MSQSPSEPAPTATDPAIQNESITRAPTIAGPAAAALHALTPAQRRFLRALPKAELHAHLNGCIPVGVLQRLAGARFGGDRSASSTPEAGGKRADSGGEDGGRSKGTPDAASEAAVRAGIERLRRGVVLAEIGDFFGLFPAIYALTSTPDALRTAARAVLQLFLDPVPSGRDGDGGAGGGADREGGEEEGEEEEAYPQAAYLELRTGPRATPHMTRMQYLEAVLDEVERYPPARAALIVSLDRRMPADVAAEVVRCAVELRARGRRVVGVDLCGDPLAGDMHAFGAYFRAAKEAGLGVTMHIAETTRNTPAETAQLLSYAPDRLGHATFLDAPTRARVLAARTQCVELCLSSNLLCRTVPVLGDHHIRHYLACGHPIAVCTDDTLPFRNSLLGEYALLMAAPPLGLGLSEAEITEIARMSMAARFPLPAAPAAH